MKRCPRCDSFFPDTDRFCEIDGALLAAEADNTATIVIDRPKVLPQPQTRNLFTILLVAGVVLGVMLFLVYFTMTPETSPEDSSQSNSNLSMTQPQQLAPRPLEPAPVASPSPSVEPSPSPSVEATPSPQVSPARVELSSNPISSAAGSKGQSGPLVIRLDTGVTIEADEAWQTGEGIWYRSRGVVTLLNPKHVKAIDRVPPPPSPQPTPSTQAPSPQQ